MVDNIMQNVLRASEDVERGRDHLNKAEKYAVSARKMKGLKISSLVKMTIQKIKVYELSF